MGASWPQEIITNYGQTSGHSFANSLQKSSAKERYEKDWVVDPKRFLSFIEFSSKTLACEQEGWYLGMDLGDNYPRGVNLWEARLTFGNVAVCELQVWFLRKSSTPNCCRWDQKSKDLRGDSRSWQKKLVYAFKTKHGTKATSPAGASYPEYTAISTADQTPPAYTYALSSVCFNHFVARLVGCAFCPGSWSGSFATVRFLVRLDS